MGTPTLKLTHVSVMNDLGTSYSSIDQSERERERENKGRKEEDKRGRLDLDCGNGGMYAM